jgi:hypothetical protein
MRRYSFQDTILAINGVEITGWADGDDVIDIERRTDSISDKVGASGEMMISVSADKSGMVTIKLQQTSPSNLYLTALCDLQEASGSLFIPCAVTFMDTYRNDIATGLSGYIKKPPKMTRGTQGNNQEWVFVVERLDLVFGDTN